VFDRQGWLPVKIDPTFEQIAVFGAFGFAALASASVVTSLTKAVRLPWAALMRQRGLKAHAEEFRAYIPHMARDSRAVFAQLLFQNRTDFTAAQDGGYAAVLIGRGYIVPCVRPGQMMHPEDVPFRVPEHIWKVATEQKDAFPYLPTRDGGDAWRVHWMAR
jgi:hypothetical protein